MKPQAVDDQDVRETVAGDDRLSRFVVVRRPGLLVEDKSIGIDVPILEQALGVLSEVDRVAKLVLIAFGNEAEPARIEVPVAVDEGCSELDLLVGLQAIGVELLVHEGCERDVVVEADVVDVLVELVIVAATAPRDVLVAKVVDRLVEVVAHLAVVRLVPLRQRVAGPPFEECVVLEQMLSVELAVPERPLDVAQLLYLDRQIGLAVEARLENRPVGARVRGQTAEAHFLRLAVLVGEVQHAREPRLEGAGVELEVIEYADVGVVDGAFVLEDTEGLPLDRLILVGPVDRPHEAEVGAAFLAVAISEAQLHLGVGRSGDVVRVPDVLEGAPDCLDLSGAEPAVTGSRTNLIGRHFVGELPRAVVDPERVVVPTVVRQEVVERGAIAVLHAEAEPDEALVRDVDRLDLDAPARELARKVGRVRLGDRHGLHDRYRKEIERNHALVGFG